MADLVVKAHDTWPAVKATLEEQVGESGQKVINLTSALKVRIVLKGSGPAIKQPCTGPSGGALGSTGVVEYIWGATDTATATEFKVEFEIEWSATHIETVPNSGTKTILVEADQG